MQRNSVYLSQKSPPDLAGVSVRVGSKFLAVSKGLKTRAPTVCKTVYSGSIPDVASNSLSRHTKNSIGDPPSLHAG